VEDRSRVAYATLIGAALGGLVGFLFFTTRGQRVRGEVMPRLGDLVDETKRLQGVVGKLREATQGGWASIAAFLSDLADRRGAERDETGGSRDGRRVH
jgi:hypothetical protein